MLALRRFLRHLPTANQEGRESSPEKRDGWFPRLVGKPTHRGRGQIPLCGVGSLLTELPARSPDHAPNEAPGLLPLSMNLRHHPTVATAIIDVGRRLFQRHGGGGGNQTDHHLVKLGNENVRGLGEQ
jgi:hypothetical protein